MEQISFANYLFSSYSHHNTIASLLVHYFICIFRASIRLHFRSCVVPISLTAEENCMRFIRVRIVINIYVVD